MVIVGSIIIADSFQLIGGHFFGTKVGENSRFVSTPNAAHSAKVFRLLSLQFCFIPLKNVMDERTPTDAPDRSSIILPGASHAHSDCF